jgi:protein-S-isoprenylcysteine O-methyltransferase Ste14
MNSFDPFGLLERLVPAQRLHMLIRVAALAVISGFLVLRVRQYHDFLFKPLWVAETLLFIILIIAFTVRRDPIDRSRGFAEIVIPLVGAVLPFGLLFTSPSAWLTGSDARLTAVFCWMTLATAFTAWSMWVLRHSFSITVEARALVTKGPYRFIRHPIYLGEMLSAAAVVIWRWSLVNIALLILFVAIQLLRSRWEEQKLEKAFPGYKEFAGRSWWF